MFYVLHLLRLYVTNVATKNNYILTIYDFYHKTKTFSQLVLRHKNNINFKQLKHEKSNIILSIAFNSYYTF